MSTHVVGNVGGSPDVKIYGENKKAVFSLVDRLVYRKPTESTQWRKIEAWNKLADVAENYIAKGSLVYVDGDLITEEYKTDAGEVKQRTYIKANKIVLLGKKESDEYVPAEDETEAKTDVTPAARPETASIDPEIPF